MPEVVSLTFRDLATGKINDFFLDEDKACGDTYLAGELLSYKDEGVECFPSIIVCDSIKNALQAFPGAVLHRIGDGPLDVASGRKIFKDCAPLCRDQWSIYIERSNNKVIYGVFTYLQLPTAISLREGITIDKSGLSALVRKINATTVELRGAKGSIGAKTRHPHCRGWSESVMAKAGEFATRVSVSSARCCSTPGTGRKASSIRRR